MSTDAEVLDDHDNDGWIVAIRSIGRRNRRRRKYVANTIACRAIRPEEFEKENKLSTKTFPFIQVEELANQVAKFRNILTTEPSFMPSIFSILDKILDNNQLAVIRVFGLGPFSSSPDSMYQLSLLECIKEHFHVPLTTSQDPLTSDSERNYLQAQSICVLPPDDLRSDPPKVPNIADDAGFTLLYMLHCTHDMYDNVLSRYDAAAHCRLIVIGNDYQDIQTALNPALMQHVHLNNFIKKCTIVPVPSFEPMKFAFNSTAIWIVKDDDDEGDGSI